MWTDELDLQPVSPHPELAERLRQDFEKARAAGGASRGLLRLRQHRAMGLNDGLIIPGSEFPLGTPARVVRQAAAERAPLRGTIRVAVVLVEFSDRKFSSAHTVEHFTRLFFSTGELPNGSAREYYHDVSNGLVELTGEVVGPYLLPRKVSEYAHGESGLGTASPNARTMALDAAKAANPHLNFGPYDNDGNGYVDAFIVVHAGAGAEVTGNDGDIWSHKWVLEGGAYSADGVKIYAYLTVPEDARLGVCVHELGHLVFGWPDFYDTDEDAVAEGLGNWCLMASGSWGGGGDKPSHPSAWCKAQQGWVSTVVQTSNATVKVQDVKDGHKVYRLWKDGGSGKEYFLLENRQRKGYDSSLPGQGLLIYHVDDNIDGNDDTAHPQVALMQADGLKGLELGSNRGDAGDPYPGASNNRTFSGTSTPNSKSYGGVSTCVAVTSIPDSASTMKVKLTVRCFTKLKETKENTKDYDKRLSSEKLQRIEKGWVEKGEEKYYDKLNEGPFGPGYPGYIGGIPQPPQEFMTRLEHRLATLEAALAALQPFIDASLRPDLSRGALSEEGEGGRELSDPGEKRLFDKLP